MSKRLTEEFDTIATMEKNLLDEYGAITGTDGVIRFADSNTAKEFAEKYKEAMEQDDDINLPTVDLSKYVDIVRISASAMDALDGIVVFEKSTE